MINKNRANKKTHHYCLIVLCVVLNAEADEIYFKVECKRLPWLDLPQAHFHTYRNGCIPEQPEGQHVTKTDRCDY